MYHLLGPRARRKQNYFVLLSAFLFFFLNLYSHTLYITHLKKRPLVKKLNCISWRIDPSCFRRFSFFLPNKIIGRIQTAVGEWVAGSVLWGPTATCLVPAGRAAVVEAWHACTGAWGGFDPHERGDLPIVRTIYASHERNPTKSRPEAFSLFSSLSCTDTHGWAEQVAGSASTTACM